MRAWRPHRGSHGALQQSIAPKGVCVKGPQARLDAAREAPADPSPLGLRLDVHEDPPDGWDLRLEPLLQVVSEVVGLAHGHVRIGEAVDDHVIAV